MEERDGIPEDIMDAAATAGKQGTLSDIARAIRAERERCARIAETYGVYPELNVFGGGPEWYRHGKNIARAIRNP